MASEMEAPERIWVDMARPIRRVGGDWSTVKGMHMDTEYIRSDLVASAIATERTETLKGVVEMLRGLRSKEMVVKDIEAAIKKS